MKEILWCPSKKSQEKTRMRAYLNHVAQKYGLAIQDYPALHRWSVENPETFWKDVWSYFEVIGEGDLFPPLKDSGWKQYSWFPRLKLNFAQNLLSRGKDTSVALNFVQEAGEGKKLSYQTLRESVYKLSGALEAIVEEGDVLAAYMPNIPETVISMLACTSRGGVFTSTSCDFGLQGVLDRFSQSNPRVLVTVTGYRYKGKIFDLRKNVKELVHRLPSLKKVIVVDFLKDDRDISDIPKALGWDEFLDAHPQPSPFFRRVSFSSPLYIMYSSGTTGKPKAIVHSVGGVLLQHIKELGLHTDVTEEKSIFYFTTCGWMMWNWLVSSLFFGAQVTLYEGPPTYPTIKDFFGIIEREGINIFGTSPKFLRALEDSGYDNDYRLNSLETILSTGAPLLPEQFDFVYQRIKKDILLGSICGGTDILGCFMLGNPILPVRRGKIQCLGLGMDVACFNSEGRSVIDQEGELICRQTFPSRPVSFLNDPDNHRLNKSYFNKFPGVWYHGDFISMNAKGEIIVYGRSDATLNPGGVRIGTAEIYRQTEGLKYLEDSICVGKSEKGDVKVILFVKMADQYKLTDEKIEEIKTAIRKGTTPRHVPVAIYPVSDIPYTRSGKKMELTVTQVINGQTPDNLEAVMNPECLQEYRCQNYSVLKL